MTQNPYTHTTKSKAKEQRFYCCSSSQSHSKAFNMEQTARTTLQVQDGPCFLDVHVLFCTKMCEKKSMENQENQQIFKTLQFSE